MNAAAHRDFWRGRLNLPNYGVGEAARYAKISASTIGRWQRDTTKAKREARKGLSYLELIEVAIVAAAREAGMKLREIEAAHAYFAKHYGDYPFATLELKTDGVDLALEAGAELLLGNKGGQLAWNEVIGRKFKEFEYDGGFASRWRVAGEDSPVLIDPRVRFGAPQVGGVPTWLLKDRWMAGEPLNEITDDLNLRPAEVRAALRFEGIEPEAGRSKEWQN